MKKAVFEKDEPTTWSEFVTAVMRDLIDAFIRGGTPAMRIVLHGALTYFVTWHPRAMEIWKRAEKQERKRVP